MNTVQTNNLDGAEIAVNLGFDSDAVTPSAGNLQKLEVMGEEVIGEALELRTFTIREGLEGGHSEGSK